MTEHNYSKKAIYNSKIKPLVKKIQLACDEYKLPMFMTFAVENTPNNTVYVNEMHSAAACETVLTNDRLVKHALILNDFEEYLPKFKKIIPYDYKKMLNAIAKMEEKGLNPEQAQIEAFYAATR